MTADKLAALEAAAGPPYTPEREGGYWSALMTLVNVLPALVELVRAAEDFCAYWRAREATWATFGQCEEDGHIGHTEDTCPAWGSVTSFTMSDGDHKPIDVALDALDEALR